MTQKIAMETSVWRGNPAVSSAARASSWDINDLLVRHLLVEAGLHGALHHVGDGFAHLRVPRVLDHHVEPLTGNRGGEDARWHLDGVDGDLVCGGGVVAQHAGNILECGEQHL